MVEVIVAASVFLLLLGILVAAFYQSTNVMLKGQSQSNLQRDALVFERKLSTAVQFGNITSLSLAADQSGIAFLSSYDVNGEFRYDPALSVALWSNYLVFYFLPGQNEIQLREISVIGSPQEAAPGPIENFGTPQAIETYFTGGKPILRNVEAAVFSQPVPGLIKASIDLAKDDTRKEGPETYTFTVTRNFRN